MRVLLVNDYGTPAGGAEIVTLTLRDALRTLGHDARLLTSSAGLSRNDARPDYVCSGTTSRARALVQTVNPHAVRVLRRVLSEFAPEVVHVRMFLTQLSPWILRALRAACTGASG